MPGELNQIDQVSKQDCIVENGARAEAGAMSGNLMAVFGLSMSERCRKGDVMIKGIVSLYL